MKYQLLQNQMLGSAEGKHKSKYQNSSNKIKQLYSEFESLKNRINTPSKRKKFEYTYPNSEHENSLINTQSDNFNYGMQRISTDQRKNPRIPKITFDFQTKTFLKTSFQMFMNNNMRNLDRKIDQKCMILAERIHNLNQLHQAILKSKTLKKQNPCLLSKIQNKCNCKWRGDQIKQIQEKYQKTIKQLIQSYESRINLLVKEGNIYETSVSSHSKNNSKALKDEIQNFEEKMFMKQRQITELKSQISQLNRQIDSIQKSFKDKEKHVQTLLQQANSQQKYIDQLNQTLKNHQAKYDQKIKIIQQQNLFKEIKMEQQINCLKGALKNQTNTYNVPKTKQIKIQKKEQNEENIENDEKDEKDKKDEKDENEENLLNSSRIMIDDREIQSDFEIQQKEQKINYNRLQQSHIVKVTTMNSYHLQTKIKDLQIELQLIEEQNRVLKQKKNKFEEQVKQNETDQQRFQIQSTILREQLKRTNSIIKNLDQCAVMYYKDKKVPMDNLEKLDNALLFKKQLLDKLPKRKNSMARTIK